VKGTLKIGIRAIGTLQIGIRAKVLTLSLDGPVERSLDRKCEEKFCLEWSISNIGLFQCVKQLLDRVYKLRRFSSAVKLQLVWSTTTGRQVSTLMV
jgi:hypothetical protein